MKLRDYVKTHFVGAPTESDYRAFEMVSGMKHGPLTDKSPSSGEKERITSLDNRTVNNSSQLSGNNSSYSSRYSETENGVTLSYVPPKGWTPQDYPGHIFKCVIRPDRSAIIFYACDDTTTDQLLKDFEQKGYRAQEIGPFRSDYGIHATRVKYFVSVNNQTHEVYTYFMQFDKTTIYADCMGADPTGFGDTFDAFARSIDVK
jgi:hypothetical protein